MMDIDAVQRLMREASDRANAAQYHLDIGRIHAALVTAGADPYLPATPEEIIEALNEAGFEIVRKKQAADQDTAEPKNGL